MEQASDLYDWTALLWGSVPAKELLANAIMRRRPPCSKLQETVWTRVNCLCCVAEHERSDYTEAAQQFKCAPGFSHGLLDTHHDLFVPNLFIRLQSSGPFAAQIKIHDGRDVESEQLRNHQAAHHGKS
jgi:hypothetical protein